MIFSRRYGYYNVHIYWSCPNYYNDYCAWWPITISIKRNKYIRKSLGNTWVIRWNGKWVKVKC